MFLFCLFVCLFCLAFLVAIFIILSLSLITYPLNISGHQKILVGVFQVYLRTAQIVKKTHTSLSPIPIYQLRAWDALGIFAQYWFLHIVLPILLLFCVCILYLNMPRLQQLMSHSKTRLWHHPPLIMGTLLPGFCDWISIFLVQGIPFPNNQLVNCTPEALVSPPVALFFLH